MIAPFRLYLDSTRTHVVREDDSEAAFLLAAKGSEVPKMYHAMVEAMGKPAIAPEEIDDRKTRVVPKLAKR